MIKTQMFPGQGSQKIGMGEGLFEQFAQLTQIADDILGYSIKQLCLEDTRNELGQTQFTQPALFVVNALSYYQKLEQNGQKPDFVIGHSLGEFNALLAAECFDFATGLKLVKKRGELMSEVTGGGMAAISNACAKQITTMLADNGLTSIALANFNTPNQIVISGLKEDIVKAQALFEEGDMMYHLLNTSGAFHSNYMTLSKTKFAQYLEQFTLSAPKIPVISNVTAKPYDDNALKANLASQIASSVLFSDSIEYLINQGEQAGEEMQFEEVGHGRVLGGLVRRIKRELAKTPVVTKPVVTKPAVVNKPPSFADAEQKVRDWNLKFAVGTRVKSTQLVSDLFETRSQAVVLFGHRAAVYMKDHQGYFDLNELAPL